MGMAHAIHSWENVCAQLVGKDLAAIVPAVLACGDSAVQMNVDVEMVQSATMKQESVCVFRDGEAETARSRALLGPLVITAFRHAIVAIMRRAVAVMAFVNASLDGWDLGAHKHARKVILGASV